MGEGEWGCARIETEAECARTEVEAEWGAGVSRWGRMIGVSEGRRRRRIGETGMSRSIAVAEGGADGEGERMAYCGEDARFGPIAIK